MTDHTPLKSCTQCGNSYPATTEYFNKAKESRDGLRHECRTCRAAIMKAWHKSNPERSRELRKIRFEKNLEQEREDSRRWYANNKDRMREYHRAWSKNNRDKANLHARLRHARAAAKTHAFTESDWRYAITYFNGCCAVCSRPPGLWHTLAMDHWIPVSSPDCPGTIPTNIVPLCHGVDGCNNKKQNRVAAEWLVRELGKSKGRKVVAKIQRYFDGLQGEA